MISFRGITAGAMAIAGCCACSRDRGAPEAHAMPVRLFTSASPWRGTGGPLVVNETSHVVVIEYEAWFGPNAVTLQGTSAKPLLLSQDMQAAGGGYDSADPAVIKTHVAWLEQMGIDAAIGEITNNVSCIFNSEWFVRKYLQNVTGCRMHRRQYQAMRDNTGNLYSAWSKLGTRLKLIPLLGAIDQNVLFTDIDGKTAFEKEVDYFRSLMQAFPNRNVIYQGKPLMLIYLGAAQNPNRADAPLWAQIEQFLHDHPAINREFTFRLMAGFLDSQPALWATRDTPRSPVQIYPA